MPLTKVSAGVIAANAVQESVGSQSITGDKLGLTAINANNIASNAVTGDKLGLTAVSSNNIVSVSGSVITANTVANSAFQTGSIENYSRATGLLSGMRNRIINGAMVIAQRGTSAVTGNDSYPVDRWNIGNSTDGSFSAIQDSDAPAGFFESVKFTITTADASVTGTQSLFMVQPIEGLNTADLNWGTANAKTVTLSFWVKSSVTGTFSGSLMNGSVNRAYPFTYTINSANTWEFETITIAGDTTGTWNTDNSGGILLYFSLGTGSTRLGTAGAWAGSRLQGATGETALVNTLNATWFITGCQLEVGSTATSFDYRPYGTELSLCYRYCYNLYTGANLFYAQGNYYTGTEVLTIIPFPVTMRTTPTISYAGLTTFYRNGTNDSNNVSSWTLQYSSTNFANLSATSMSGTAGQAGTLYSTNAAAKMSFLAEL